VVDQNSDLRLLYTDALAGPRCQVDVAEDGAAAWEALQARRYSLLLTENDLPSLTGDELITKLRSARIELPVVMAVGGRPMRGAGQNPSLQFAATLLKPFDLDALRCTVKNVLRTAIPVCQHTPRRTSRPGHDRTPSNLPAYAYENASQEQAVNV
jgi:type IV pilus assembly protein PilB